MRNEIRDAVVTEVESRILEACLRQAELPGGLPLDVLVNDTLYHEKKRLELHPQAPGRDDDLAFWGHVKSRLGNAGGPELRRLLQEIIDRFVREVLGNFSDAVYRLSTSVLPRTLPVLLNAMSPQRLLSKGMPDLSDTIRIEGDIEGLRRCERLGTVILTPTHVSNLDSVVIGWALYAMGLKPFTFGAGLNLFANPLLSFFMRNLGAYRVDRTKTAPLYKDVLKEYATVTLEMGQSQLFFPGGTRARSGFIEQHLKLGLLSSGIHAYINNLVRGRARPRVYVVPCTTSYEVVLEGETLIEDHLKLVGKSRYIITDDESFRPKQVMRFFRSVLAMDGRIVLRIADPLDVFGNRVDAEGESIDARGRRVDISRYVLDDTGRPAHVPQRDRVYVREVGAAVARAFREHNVVLATNLVAFTLFEHLKARHPTMDLYRLLRTGGDGTGVEMGVFAERVRAVAVAARELADAGELHVTDAVAEGNPARLVGSALRHYGSYHRNPVITRRGDRVFAGDMNLLYYYHNRLAGYGLEAAAVADSREVA
ncbi:MAG: 1-acyl-sn-glycerol-3-phosphate acyltransferase [Deltaproteobacteria bacterium]|nr:1-acyl-sn-glycerol-3-phosphate acyltransferase [Deltaproteobacteria bacterium]MCB9786121.1 1-acyl-sn-glycerol-3-phosphate acyltransferase [Deltaproteobacteria bacterium]